MKNKRIKPMPKFNNEDEERKFWDTHDLTDYFDHFQPINLDLSSLKPSTKPITIRLPESLIGSLKTIANKKDVPYQSLMKMFLSERIEKELSRTGNSRRFV
jgi:predicted DNA binding CopG/RHH family protein